MQCAAYSSEYNSIPTTRRVGRGHYQKNERESRPFQMQGGFLLMHIFDLAMIDRDKVEESTDYRRTRSIQKQYKRGAKQKGEPRNDQRPYDDNPCDAAGLKSTRTKGTSISSPSSSSAQISKIKSFACDGMGFLLTVSTSLGRVRFIREACLAAKNEL